jgi:hypothetical protein
MLRRQLDRADLLIVHRGPAPHAIDEEQTEQRRDDTPSLARGWVVERFRRIVKVVGFAVAVAAIVEQLRLPADERTWEGRVAGLVPYDFRVPTLERARSRWWNPEDERVFVPTVFGVGWTVNLARLGRLLGIVGASR